MSPNLGFRGFVPCAYFKTGLQTNRILTCNEYIHSLRRIHRNEPINVEELNEIANDDITYASNPDDDESVSLGNLTTASAFSWNSNNRAMRRINISGLEGLVIDTMESNDDGDNATISPMTQATRSVQSVSSVSTQNENNRNDEIKKADTCIIGCDTPNNNETQRRKPAWILCPNCVEKPMLCFPTCMIKYISKEQDRETDGDAVLRPRCPMCRSEFTEILSGKNEVLNIIEGTGANVAWLSVRQLEDHTQRTPCERCSQFAIFNPIPVPDDVERVFHSNYTGHRGRCRTNRHEAQAQRQIERENAERESEIIEGVENLLV